MSTEHQRGHVHRELVKGKLRPPLKPPSTKSYTVAPASINEVMVRRPSERQTVLLRSRPRLQLNRF
ncbi:uncharacterized protein F4817DRAFT_302891 [Daldinia loculata]|uniref:uncharacterized protein n=1 Tax=Daldinia loculata TaxID=103429 RepID=UPI0020C4148F|nr:uncharacterized protein F4817DRAFT_302891 [Daldinia loculata]KAI1650032.1 hypothetical protein F4817DRAFT_302891 [Daldinia loculata]